MENFGKDFADKLKDALKKLGITHEHFCELMSNEYDTYPSADTFLTYLSRGFPSKYYLSGFSTLVDAFERAINKASTASPTISRLWAEKKEEIINDLHKVHNSAVNR